MADMFGSPIGQQHAIESQLNLAELAMAPDKSRLLGAKADLAQNQAEAQKRFTEMMNNAQDKSLWGAASAALRSGMPDAYKWANAASTAEYRRAAANTQELRAAELGLKVQTADLDLRARSLTGVNNLPGLQTAFRDYENQSGKKSGYLDDEGNLLPGIREEDVPAIVGRERAKALSTKDQLLTDFRNRQLQSQDKERKSKQTSRLFWQDMDNQYNREAARQKARADKGGGTGLFPSGAQITVGADYLSNKFNTDPKDPWSRVLGRELVDTAKRMKAQNPALSASEALDEAFKRLDKDGMFGGKHLADKKADLLRPTTLPYKDGKPDKDKLVEGQLYRDDSGETREWTGKGWSTPSRKIIQGGAPVTEEQARAALSLQSDEDADGEDPDDEDD